MRQGQTLQSPEHRKVLADLCSLGLPVQETIDRFRAETGLEIHKDTVYKSRARDASGYTSSPHHRRVADYGSCARCRKLPGTLPGEPWGFKRPVCKGCSEEVQEERREVQWMLAQSRHQREIERRKLA